MAVVADEIVAAPLAVVGSIGVLLPVPNVHRWLKERGVEYDEMTERVQAHREPRRRDHA